ncbi:MAG: WecB/TagA/CpsF family glycosyltransferase [Tepidisphaeraceae bacterium]
MTNAPYPRLNRSYSPLPPHLDEGSIDEAPLPVIRLKGVELHAITETQAIEHILTALENGRGGSVVTPNLDIIRRCTKDLQFATLVSEADLVVADGTPLIWASRLQGTPLPQRIAGSDLISSLSLAAADAGRSVFLLGGTPGAAEGAAKVLQAKAPHLKVAGTYCPPIGFEKDANEYDKLISTLAQAKPDIVWVALGSPKQENLINRIRDVLPHAWWLGVGISFSFLAGDVKRAPRWMQKSGIEWLHRLTQEPKRLFQRYILHGIPFCGTLLAGALWNRIAANQDETAGHRFRGRRRRRVEETAPAASDGLPLPAADNTLTLRVPPLDAGSSIPPCDANPFSRRYDSNGRRGLKRLKAVILLGGKVRQSELGSAIGRSVLDLPLDEHGTILNHWVTQSNELAKRVGLDDLVVRVMVDQKAHAPISIDPQFKHMVCVERDQSSFRGTGGLLADIAAGYGDDDLILVANAGQVLFDPLSAIAQALDHKTGDFTLINHRDGTASGIMLLACKTVRSISNVGFIDLKEQALPSIAKLHDVRVVHCRQPTGLPLFSLNDYITALQQFHRRRSSRRARTNPLGEEFGRHFAIIENGAEVAPDAYLHDAVVLKGAKVDAGAAAIRSLVLPGAVLRRGQQVSDQLIGQTS